jgi:hypothetical protein
MKYSLSIDQIYFKIFIYLIYLLGILVLLQIVPLFLPRIANLFLSFLIFLILPGFALYNVLVKNNNFEIVERLLLYFLFSLILIAPIILIGYFLTLKVEIAGMIIFLLGGVVALVDLGLILIRRENKKMIFAVKELFQKIQAWSTWRTLIVFLVAILTAILIFKVQILIGNDAQVHIAIIRKMIDYQISSQNPFFVGLGDLSIYAYSLWQPVVAIVTKFANVDPIYSWHRLAVFLTPLIFFATYFFSKNLFKNRNAAFSCVLVIFYFFAFVGFTTGNGQDLRTLIYPRNIDLFILMPLFFGWFFRLIRADNQQKKWPIMILVALIGFLILFTHMFYFILINFAIAAFLILYWLINRKKIRIDRYQEIKKIVSVWVLVVLVAVPYILLRLKTNLISEDVINLHNWGSLRRADLIRLSGNWFILRPFFLYPGRILWGVRSFLAPLAYFILTPLLLIWFRTKPWAIFLTALMLITPFISFNPLLIAWLGQIIGYPKIVRIYQIAPIYYLAGFFIWWFVSHLKINLRQINFLKALVVAILVLIVFLLSPFSQYQTILARQQMKKGQAIYLSEESFAFLRTLKKGSVIVAPDHLSKNITMASSNYVVSISNFHGFWGRKIIDPRIKDQHNILDPRVNLKKTLRLLKKYQVDYILLNPKDNKFGENRFFKRIYLDSSCKIFQIRWLNI